MLKIKETRGLRPHSLPFAPPRMVFRPVGLHPPGVLYRLARIQTSSWVYGTHENEQNTKGFFNILLQYLHIRRNADSLL